MSKSLAHLLMKLGTRRVVIGALTTGATGLTVKHQLEEARKGLGGTVLSEGDEVAFLNAAVQPIWSHLDAGFRKLIIEEFEPALQERVPVLGKYLRFEQLTLGSKSPRLGPVTVTRSSDGVDMNVGFNFHGDGAVKFVAGVTSIDVAGLSVKGSVQVSLRPLVDALNPIGGVTVWCLDRPEIELKILTGSDMVPNLYDFIREAVDDVVAQMIVVPNGVSAALDTLGPPTDWLKLRYPLPRGVLRLRCLAAADGGSSTQLRTNPRVELHVGASRWTGPLAGISRDFPVYSERQSVELRLLGRSSVLGRCRVPLPEILGRNEVELLDAEGEATGLSMEVRADWLAVDTDGWRALTENDTDCSSTSESDVLVSVHVDTVSGLPAQPGQRYSIRVTSGSYSETTAPGTAPRPAEAVLTEEAFIRLAGKLYSCLPLADVADILGISESHVREFAEHRSMARAEEATGRWETEWCHRARAAAEDLDASRSPHFDHVTHLSASHSGQLTLELLGHTQGSFRRSSQAVLATFSQNLIEVPGDLQGPFFFKLADGRQCAVQGSIQLRRLRALRPDM